VALAQRGSDVFSVRSNAGVPDVSAGGTLLLVNLLAFQFFGAVGVLALGDWWAFLWFGGLCIGIAWLGVVFLAAGFFVQGWRDDSTRPAGSEEPPT
jgi:hypothetical protein